MVVSLLPVGAGLLLYGLLDRVMKLLLVFLIVSTIASSVSLILAIKNVNNMMVLHLYTLIEYSFLISVFSLWQDSRKIRKGLLLTIPLFLLFWLGTKIIVGNPLMFDRYTSSLASSVLVIVAAYTIMGLVRESIQSLFRDPRFWVSASVFIYFAGNLTLFSLSTVILAKAWMIHNVLHIVTDLGYSGGFLCQYNR